jgi:methylase of polypeptide subunit release factors
MGPECASLNCRNAFILIVLAILLLLAILKAQIHELDVHEAALDMAKEGIKQPGIEDMEPNALKPLEEASSKHFGGIGFNQSNEFLAN